MKPKDVHGREGPDEGEGDADGDPERKAQLQEERQRQHDEQEAQRGVLDHEPEPVLQDVGVVVPDVQGDPRRKFREDLVFQLDLDRLHDLQDPFVRGAKDLDERCGLSVVAGDEVRVLESVDHRRDVPESHDRAVGPAQHHDLLEVLLIVVLAEGADAHGFVARLDASGRQVQTALADQSRDIGEGEIQRAEPVLGDLYGDLVPADSAGLDEGNLLQRRERVLGPVGDLLDGAFGDLAVDGQLDDALAIRELAEVRALGAVGEGRDLVDLGLHLVEDGGHVRAQLELQGDDGDALGGHRGDLLDLVDRLHLFFDLDDDRLLDLVRCGAGVGHGHRNRVEGELGEDLLHQGGEGDDPRQDDENQEEVGGHRMTGHVGHRPRVVLGTPPALPVAGFRDLVPRGHRSVSSGFGRTFMPSVTTDTPETMTGWSARRSPST